MPIRNLFVTTDTALDTGTAAYTDPTLVADGALAVLNSEDASSGSEDLTGTALPDKFTIVRGGDNPQISHLEKSKIKKVLTQAFRAEVQQVTTVGYNGTTGALSNDSGIASIKVTRVEAGYEPYPRVSATTKTKTLPYDTAAELVKQFNSISVDKIFGSQTRRFVDADILSSEDSTQLQDDVTAASVTLAVTNGSKTVIATVSNGEEIATLADGEQIRIGHATDESFPVYVAETIAAGSGTTQEITLDRPYAGATATGVAAGIVTAGAPASDDEVGVVITARASVDGEPAISFRTSVDDILVDDLITSIATPQTGAGLTAQVKNIEKFSWGNRSYIMTNYFPQTPDSNVASGVNYDLLTIIYENNNDDDVVASNANREIHLAYPEGNITLATLAAFFNS